MTRQQKPWTVNLENVADHALPLARWINRCLWRWSPWHLRHDREEVVAQCDRLGSRNIMLAISLNAATTTIDRMMEEQTKHLRDGINRMVARAESKTEQANG